MAESDLYEPVRAFFTEAGYAVQAEVKGCDVVATREDDLVIVELKASANLTLLIQATARQSLTEAVYVAIPEPKKKRNHWRGTKRVLKQLGLGLLTVKSTPLGDSVTCHFDPTYGTRKNNRKKRALQKEIDNRSGSYNVGGVTGTPIITAYRENAILLAICLDRLGPSSGKALKKLTGCDNATSIMYKNHYGWFERLDKGVYTISTHALNEINKFPEVANQAVKRVSLLLQAQAD